jgi:uncharacterized membrane protein
MERRVRQVWMVLHIISSVGWMGTILAAIALSVAGLTTDDLDRVNSLYVAMEVLAGTFFLPGTALMVITGVVLGLGTKWGLVKWWWVTVKLGIGLVLFAAGAFNLRFAVYGAADKASELRPLESSVDVSLFGMLCVMAGLGIFSALLSVLKPWGRIRKRGTANATSTNRREVVQESSS